MQATVSLGNFNTLTVSGDTAEDLVRGLAELGALAPTAVENINIIAAAGKALAAKANVSPAGQPTVEPGTGAPKCDCGIPMNDCEGKKTKGGAPYKFRYYTACDKKCAPKVAVK